MNSREKLKELFNSELNGALSSLEPQRKEIRKQYLISACVFILGGLLFIFDLQVDARLLIALKIAAVILFIISQVFLYEKLVTYKKDFKNNVVKKVVALIDPEWSYAPTSYIEEEEYDKSGIFTKTCNRYKGDDLIYGKIDKTDFRLSELHTEYKTESEDGDGNSSDSWYTIFKGLFAHADFNKEIKGKTYVLPDVPSKWRQKFQRLNSRGKLVKLENLEFEKYFVVSSDDQIEARYILTPKMMEAILNIKKQLNKKIYISFIGSRVYIAIAISGNLFEPKVFKSGVNYSDVEQIYFYFNTISIMVNEMNLNTRIWSKI